jgi:hypothetical protein
VPRIVELPVYTWWSFGTGPAGDFEELVTRLQPLAHDAAPGFGGRSIALEDPPAMLTLDGALRVPGPPVPLGWDDATRDAFTEKLRRQLDFPAAAKPLDPDLSAVGPPIYGSRHAGVATVPPADGWLRQLNLNPVRRVAGGFGAAYVQREQEALIAQAWDQVGPIRDANRLRRVAELSTVVATRAHERHVRSLTTSEMVALAAPAGSRLPAQAGLTLTAAVDDSPLPNGAATVAWRRLTRPGGPIARRWSEVAAERAAPATTGVIPKALQGEASSGLRFDVLDPG